MKRRASPCRRLVVVATALVALCCATAARADVQPVPAGFTANAALSKAASYVAGKPVTDYCADSTKDFNTAAITATGIANPGGAGFSKPGDTRSFLTTWVCSYLNRWLEKKPVARLHLAAALLTLGHEAELLSGVTDESVADCKAMALMPQLVARFFPLRKAYKLDDLMDDVRYAHSAQPPVYLTSC